jgi:hypothetical protein
MLSCSFLLQSEQLRAAGETWKTDKELLHMVRVSHGMKQPNSTAERSKLGNGQAAQLL